MGGVCSFSTVAPLESLSATNPPITSSASSFSAQKRIRIQHFSTSIQALPHDNKLRQNCRAARTSVDIGVELNGRGVLSGARLRARDRGDRRAATARDALRCRARRAPLLWVLAQMRRHVPDEEINHHSEETTNTCRELQTRFHTNFLVVDPFVSFTIKRREVETSAHHFDTGHRTPHSTSPGTKILFNSNVVSLHIRQTIKWITPTKSCTSLNFIVILVKKNPRPTHKKNKPFLVVDFRQNPVLYTHKANVLLRVRITTKVQYLPAVPQMTGKSAENKQVKLHENERWRTKQLCHPFQNKHKRLQQISLDRQMTLTFRGRRPGLRVAPRMRISPPRRRRQSQERCAPCTSRSSRFHELVWQHELLSSCTRQYSPASAGS